MRIILLCFVNQIIYIELYAQWAFNIHNNNSQGDYAIQLQIRQGRYWQRANHAVIVVWNDIKIRSSNTVFYV